MVEFEIYVYVVYVYILSKMKHSYLDGGEQPLRLTKLGNLKNLRVSIHVSTL